MVQRGRNINKEILSQPKIKGVGFIGSNKVGHELFELCGQLRKTSSINGNGKNHVVIMPDVNLEDGAQWLLRASFDMGGQRCLGHSACILTGSG